MNQEEPSALKLLLVGIVGILFWGYFSYTTYLMIMALIELAQKK